MTKALLAATGLFALVAACDAQQPREDRASAPEQAARETPASEASPTIAALAAPRSREAALKLMHDRHENMETIGDSTKPVGRTLRTDNPDLAVIRKSAATIARLAPQVPSWFPPGTGPDVGDTEAKAEIWQNPEDFTAKARDFNRAAKAFHAAARSGDMAAIRDRFGAMMKSCKACHESYREDH